MELKIYHKFYNINIFKGTYNELIKYCNSVEYKNFLKSKNKKDYSLTEI